MKIQELFCYLPEKIIQGRENITINELCYDSRKAKPGDLFVALKGAKADGHSYIPDLLKQGVFVVAEKNSFSGTHPAVFLVEDTRKALALLSKAFFKNPDQDLFIIGITGTNGKTTTTYMIKAILEEAGLKTGIIGTIQYLIGDEKRKAENTTPESFEIYKMIREMREKGCKALAIELSSHAIVMHRVLGLDLDSVIFSNLTQDHLDYHVTMEEYFKAKLGVFDLLKNSSKPQKLALINQDIPQADQIKAYLNNLELDYHTFGIKNVADWRAESTAMNIYHNIFTVFWHKEEFIIDTPMLGEFNIYNAVSAIAAVHLKGIKKHEIEQGLKKVKVIGRFERIFTHLGFGVLVDYAHTPDALENILKTGRTLNPINIITVFGAGGDRDKTKRPKMGAIAKQYSNYTIITSDNPRSEEPLTIMQEIEPPFQGCKNYELIEDREKAIERAIFMAEEGDLVIIAGKGHEDYQIFKDQTIHFSDREIAEKYIHEREKLKKT